MPNKGRPKGSRNKKHTERTAQVTLKISPALLRRWKSNCAQMDTTMSARFEQIVKQDVAIYDTFGPAIETAAQVIAEADDAEAWAKEAE